MNKGDVIGGKYRIVGMLGQGGSSTVYLAENMVLYNLWAVKTILKSSPSFEYEVKEIEILKTLSHPMLPRIADYYEDEASCYFVMDYIQGVNLLEYLANNGKVDEKTLIAWTEDLLEVLNYLHSRTPAIIYRDLKPANLILDERRKLRLVDFGTARFNHEGSTEDTIYIGTQGYAAPEQYGSGVSDQRTDLYNLGMTLIHLGTNIHPMKIESSDYLATLRRAGLSRPFCQFIRALVRLKPEERPKNSTEAIGMLPRKTGNFLFAKREKVINDKNPVRSIIGIASIASGSGATSLCFSIGSCLTKLGYRVCLLEMNTSGDFGGLEAVFDIKGLIAKQCEDYFEACGMVFYRAVTDMTKIPRSNYDILVLDLGVMNDEQVARELNHSDMKLVICPREAWKLSKIAEHRKRFDAANIHKEWIYSLTSPDKDDERFIRKLLGLERIVAFPNIKDVLNLTNEEIGMMSSVLDKVSGYCGIKMNLVR